MNESLMNIYAQEILKSHQRSLGRKKWKLNWTERATKNRFGLCEYDKNVISIYWKTIERRPKEHHREIVRQTVLHEIAHALCPYQGHSNGWKWSLSSIGGHASSDRYIRAVKK